MYKRILIPLDGSALSESALPYAEAIARASAARIVLARVALDHGLPGVDLGEEDQFKVLRDAEAYLQGVADALARRGVAAEIAASYGQPAGMLLSEAEIQGVDLIVMATHGRSGLGRFLFGSVADEIVRRGSLPMLLTPANCDHFLPTDRQPRILVTLDGSTRSEEVLPAAGQMADALGASLLLLEVTDLLPALPLGPRRDETGRLSSARDQVEGHLERLAAELRAGRRTVEIEVVAGKAAPTIVSEAHAQRADMIAMATHGRGGLARLVLGSVATATLQRAGLPMLLLRPAAMRDTSAPRASAAVV